FVQAATIHCRFDFAAGQNGLDLRREVQLAPRLGVKQRAHAKAVARQENRFSVAIVQRERELAIQPLEEIDSPFLVAMNEDFGVASRSEYVAFLLELPTQLRMVVDLAVVGDDDLPVFIRQRLI